jgi:hypothetical protein
MKIELDGIPLDTTSEGEGGVSDGRSVSNISTADKRNITSQDAPGGAGSSHNDQGRSAVVVSFDGTIFGESAKTLIEQLRSKFKGGEAVPFIADLTGMADITKVIIDSFNVNDSEGSKDRYDYSIVLKEYKEPPEEPSAPAAGAGAEAGAEAGAGGGGEEGEKTESEVDKEAKEFVEDSADNEIKKYNQVSGIVSDADDNPVAGVSVTLTRDDGIVFSGKTDDTGKYLIERVDPGNYKLKVDAEGFEDYGEDVSI